MGNMRDAIIFWSIVAVICSLTFIPAVRMGPSRGWERERVQKALGLTIMLTALSVPMMCTGYFAAIFMPMLGLCTSAIVSGVVGRFPLIVAPVASFWGQIPALIGLSMLKLDASNYTSIGGRDFSAVELLLVAWLIVSVGSGLIVSVIFWVWRGFVKVPPSGSSP
jgi:hypothetical protein